MCYHTYTAIISSLCFPSIYSLHLLLSSFYFIFSSLSFSHLYSCIFVFHSCPYSPSSAPSFSHCYFSQAAAYMHLSPDCQNLKCQGGAKKDPTNWWRVSHFVEFLDFGGINVHTSNLRGAWAEILLFFSTACGSKYAIRVEKARGKRTTLDETERYCMGKKRNHRKRDQE